MPKLGLGPKSGMKYAYLVTSKGRQDFLKVRMSSTPWDGLEAEGDIFSEEMCNLGILSLMVLANCY